MNNKNIVLDKLIVTSAGIGIFNCLGINDYSSAFLFMFLMIWTEQQSKHTAAFITFVTGALVVYDFIWVWIFGNAWYNDDITTDAWQARSTIRGLCYNFFFINMLIKCGICFIAYKIWKEDTKGELNPLMMNVQKPDYEA